MSLERTPESGAMTLHSHPEATEYRLSEKKPKVGDEVKRNGDTWVVIGVEEGKDGDTVVTLRPVDGKT
jgi:hypothetical protein